MGPAPPEHGARMRGSLTILIDPPNLHSYRSGWDHGHLAFCGADFAATKTDPVDYTAGYVPADCSYTWSPSLASPTSERGL